DPARRPPGAGRRLRGVPVDRAGAGLPPVRAGPARCLRRLRAQSPAAGHPGGRPVVRRSGRDHVGAADRAAGRHARGRGARRSRLPRRRPGCHGPARRSAAPPPRPRLGPRRPRAVAAGGLRPGGRGDCGHGCRRVGPAGLV
ncbi:MAG: hypothetical protein AVDCRST_MAG57-125, partial [uncultured Blastococcus sp.]